MDTQHSPQSDDQIAEAAPAGPAADQAKQHSIKQLYIKTWGCQMNAYDSTRMADVLAPLGYTPVDQPERADLIILNTCHIREKASEKLFSELGRLRKLRRETPGRGAMRLAVAGCVAQAEGEEILRRAPYVDLVFGPQAFHRLADMVRTLEDQAFAAAAGPAREASGAAAGRAEPARGVGLIDTDFPVESKFDELPEESAPQGVSAFLAIQEGCDKFCSFCVVPYTRGAEYSRPVLQVEAEARRLIAGGAREITLLGQNVNAYHGEGPDGRTWGLAALIERLAALPGLKRLRYTTSHPRDVDEAQIAAHRDIDILMPYLHLPVQAGADRVLKAMNRSHTADDYRRLIERFRAAREDIAISGDFIVGFPGESDSDFAETLRLVREIGYAHAYSFKYSSRPGTPAATGTPVPEAVKNARLQALQQLLDAQQEAFNRACEGETVPVLLTGPGHKPGQMMGRSPHNQSVHVVAPARLAGHIVDVRVTRGLAKSLSGDVVIDEWGTTPPASDRGGGPGAGADATPRRDQGAGQVMA